MNILGLLRHKVVLFALLGVVLVAFVGGAMPLSAAAVNVPAETPVDADGIKGFVHLQGCLDNRGERCITAGEPGAASQTIVALGRFEGTATVPRKICAYQFRVEVDNGGGFQRLPAYDSPETPADRSMGYRLLGKYAGSMHISDIPPHVFALRGDVKGALKVTLYAKRGNDCSTWSPTGYDGAHLLDGRGTMTLPPGQSNIVEEGETFKLNVQTGEGYWYIDVFDGRGNPRCDLRVSQTGFSLRILGLADDVAEGRKWIDDKGVVHQGPKPPSLGGPVSTPKCEGTTSAWRRTTPFNGQVSFTIPTGAFREGESNLWRFELRNAYTGHGSVVLSTVDKKALAPEPPTIEWNPKEPRVGENLLVTMTARVNPQTSRPIQSFTLDAWYANVDGVRPAEGSTSWISKGVKLTPGTTGNGAYTATYSIPVKEKSVIRLDVRATDTAGRTGASVLSQSDRASCAQTYGTTCMGEGDGTIVVHGANTPAGPQAPSKPSSTVTLLIAVAAAAGMMAAWRFLPAPLPLRVAAIAGLGFAALWAGIRYGGLAAW